MNFQLLDDADLGEVSAGVVSSHAFALKSSDSTVLDPRSRYNEISDIGMY